LLYGSAGSSLIIDLPVPLKVHAGFTANYVHAVNPTFDGLPPAIGQCVESYWQ
jgi:hypothetical protein